jgi:hypothetical protein
MYERIQREGRFTDRCEVIIPDGTSFHATYAARKKMPDHTLDLEKKITQLQKNGRTPRFIMAFCGNGYDLPLGACPA